MLDVIRKIAILVSWVILAGAGWGIILYGSFWIGKRL